MIVDKNKSIVDIKYNHLNLPTEIIFAPTNNNIEYLYNAIGTKLSKKVTNGGVTTTDYLSGFQYQNNVLPFFPTAEGYVKSTGSAFQYVFNYTDNLGNIRISYSDLDGNGVVGQERIRHCFGLPRRCRIHFISSILEENNYYPFGLKHQGYTNNSGESCNYKYNGKELQDELGLNFYDYGARNYDATIGRWMNIDPLAEMYRRHMLML